MQDNFSDKEYGEYFASLENSLSNTKDTKTVEPKREEIIKKPKHNKRQVKPFFAVILAFLIAISVIFAVKNSLKTSEEPKSTESTALPVEKEPKNKKTDYFAKADENTVALGDGISSKAVVFINGKDNRIVAQKNMSEKMYPASTTKVMTLLVAVENIKDFNDTFKMTYQITDPLYKEEATVAGFLSGEEINMTDLLYGTILPSGADAAIGLAVKIAGSEDAFATLMNNKATELGLKNTHFTNCTGLFNKDHYSTAEDMAVILRAAMDNDLCKKILSTYQYTTASTPQHPSGIPLENTLFKYMYGTEPEGATILGGKTGFVPESGYCIASFGESDDKTPYICVALSGESRWPAVYDQINLYSNYAK